MSIQTVTSRNLDFLSDGDINSPREWLLVRERLLNHAQELKRVRDQLTVECCALELAKLDEESVFDSRENRVTRAKLLNGCSPSSLKCSGYHVLGLVGVPLIVALCLLVQLHKLPNSSLSYSLLNAIVSVLFNFTSSALLKGFSLLISLVGLSRWFTSSAR